MAGLLTRKAFLRLWLYDYIGTSHFLHFLVALKTNLIAYLLQSEAPKDYKDFGTILQPLSKGSPPTLLVLHGKQLLAQSAG